mgnify:CR=1 FL=1
MFRRIEFGLLALHVPVLGALMIATHPWLTADSPRYLALGEALQHGRGFGLGQGAAFEPEGMRLPGYPAYLACTHWLFGDGNLAVVVMQSLLFLASVILIWRVTTRLLGARTGMIFLGLSAVYPFVAYSAFQVSAETPVVFLVAASIYCLLDPTLARCALAGILIGFAGYVRPNLLPLSVALASACVVADRKTLRGALIVVLAAGLVAMPWAVRNYRVFGVFAPTPAFSGTGPSLLLATWQARIPLPALIAYGMRGEASPEVQRAGMLDQVRDLNREIGVAPDVVFVTLQSYEGNATKAVADRVLRRAALANMRAWPLRYAWNVLECMPRLWFSSYMPERLPLLVRTLLRLEGLTVLLVGLGGAVLVTRRLRRAPQPALMAVLFSIGYFTLSLSFFHIEARFTIPARLLLLALAAHGLTEVSAIWHRKEQAHIVGHEAVEAHCQGSASTRRRRASVRDRVRMT